MKNLFFLVSFSAAIYTCTAGADPIFCDHPQPLETANLTWGRCAGADNSLVLGAVGERVVVHDSELILEGEVVPSPRKHRYFGEPLPSKIDENGTFIRGTPRRRGSATFECQPNGQWLMVPGTDTCDR